MKFCRFIKSLLIVLLMGCLVAIGGIKSLSAAETGWTSQAHSQARLIIDHDVIGPGQSLKLGLQVRLQPGWHSYWLNPGAAGEAPHIAVAISGRKLVEQGPIEWPVPELLKEGTLSAYAYKGDFFLPQSLKLAGQGDVTIKVHAEWLVCATICVPEQEDFTLSIPSDAYEVVNPDAAALFEQAERNLPQQAPFQGTLSSDNSLVIKNELFSKETVKSAYFFPFVTGLVDPDAVQKLHVEKGIMTLSLKPDASLKHDLAQERPEGLLALTDHQGQTVYMRLKTQGETLSSFPVQKENLLLVLLAAFLGGVILNAMPCVFPVLAMKCLSLIALKEAENHERQKSALYYTIGVLSSFLVLGGSLLFLRWLGKSAGWGFQFQSPYFIAVMCWVLLLLALNLSDVFYISLGRAGNALISRMNRTGGSLGVQTGRGHDLIAGLLAVLVATPCMAPFMGVAIAVALSHSALTGLVIFVLMGLGLAFPYIILANIPALVRVLPRSGAWMDVFKRFLAFPLWASCVWLLWVGVLQNGADFIVPVAGGGVLLALSAWLYGLVQKNRMAGKYERLNVLNYVVISSLVVITMVLLITQVTSDSSDKGQTESQISRALPEGWEPFSEKRLAQLRKEGKPVFVDMTASWCVTCLVNEHVALKIPSVMAAFKHYNVTVMVGDWTKRDEEISRYLKNYGRDGVPLYVYYPPRPSMEGIGGPDDIKGKILPQVLTPSLILTMLEQSLPETKR